MSTKNDKLSLKDLSQGLLGAKRKEYWRSLDQLAQTDEFNKWIEDEFPERKSLLDVDRRQFVKLMGASMLMASLAGCRNLPQEKIVPYVKAPEGSVPGISEFYATSLTIGGYGFGALVESRSGRPGKVDGHPAHPATMGASDHLMQAALFDMYDPDRMQSVEENDLVSNWETFANAIRAKIAESNGSKVRFLTGTVTSPTLTRLIGDFLSKHPGAKWHSYDPFGEDNLIAGSKMAFGQALQPVYMLDKADVVLSLDGDFLMQGPGHIRYSRDFASKRVIEDTDPTLNRLYAIHSEATITSAAADHRLAVKPSKVEQYARALLMLLDGRSGEGVEGEAVKWLAAVAEDLKAHQGRCAVLAGDHQSPVVHAVAAAMNVKLGAVGQTVNYIERVTTSAENHHESLKELVDAMNAGQVDAVIMIGTNPVFTAPADLKFAEALAKVPVRVSHSTHKDETAMACNWRLPDAHALESWGDARAFDGTISIQQPLIAPLYAGRSSIELLSLLEDTKLNGRQLLMDTYRARLGSDAESAFNALVHDGIVPGAAMAVPVTLNEGFMAQAPASSGSDLELLIVPDANIGDGRFANNAWLQELPRPMTSVTWDNTVDMSPKTAEKLGIKSTEMGAWVNVTVGGNTVKGMANVVPGTADDTIVIHAGYGREAGGLIATGKSLSLPEQAHPLKPNGDEVGFNVYPLLLAGGSVGVGCEVAKAGGKGRIASVQTHHSMEGRDIVRSGTLEEFKAKPDLEPVHAHKVPDITLYNQTAKDSEGQNMWAMTIDLSLCTGCNACTIACQAENNIPSVGKEQVLRGREMHWLRVDRYNVGSPENPSETVFQPVACLHCEKAPCEPVCPVAATVHSKDGLNQMVYNRCVGTRYCSNNCPYKVRRFNFLNYADKVDKPSLTLLNNPEVTVRGRGVMEKCTYCVQRISHARITAKKEGRDIRDGEVKTACQVACPSQAIIFGDYAQADSAIAKSRKNPRNYILLKELNTTPRTTYLGRVRNPNPAVAALEPKPAQEHEAH